MVPSMWTHLFGSAGPLTDAFEGLAAAIGAGVVVGSFVGGITSSVSRRLRRNSEKWTVIGGYFGGGLALMALATDILRKHFV
jgi:hypothetical protein